MLGLLELRRHLISTKQTLLFPGSERGRGRYQMEHQKPLWKEKLLLYSSKFLGWQTDIEAINRRQTNLIVYTWGLPYT